MIKAERRTLLNMEELNRVTGGVTYEYGSYAVVIPDDEKDPYGEAMRVFIGGYVATAKKNGKTLEETKNIYRHDEVTDRVITYYWDRIVLR